MFLCKNVSHAKVLDGAIGINLDVFRNDIPNKGVEANIFVTGSRAAQC
jgi:hypothetical protein